MSECTGIWIDRDVLDLPNLPFLHKGVLAQIIALSKEDGVCRATDGYLAKLFQVEAPNINRIVKNLSSLGYIQVSTNRQEGNKRSIRPSINMIEPTVEMIEPFYQNDRTLLSNLQNPSIAMIEPFYQNDNSLYKVESKEESKEENKEEIHNGEEVIFLISSQEVEEEKAPPVAQPPPKKSLKQKVAAVAPKLVEHTFAEDELGKPENFNAFFAQSYPTLDANYYYFQVSKWIDRKTGEAPKRKIWASVVNQFITNDYKKGQLQLSKQSQHEAKREQFQQLNDEADEWLEQRIARRNAKRGT